MKKQVFTGWVTKDTKKLFWWGESGMLRGNAIALRKRKKDIHSMQVELLGIMKVKITIETVEKVV